jgi:hypothetical protein
MLSWVFNMIFYIHSGRITKVNSCPWLDNPIFRLFVETGSMGLALKAETAIPFANSGVELTVAARCCLCPFLFGNIDLFPRAKRPVSAPLWESLNRQGFEGFHAVKDGEEIDDGVRVLYTPGHTDHHASVLVASRLAGLKARVAIAGDAIISSGYFAQKKVWKHNADFYDYKAALESVRLLVDLSDIIIPGHGAPFTTYRPA